MNTELYKSIQFDEIKETIAKYALGNKSRGLLKDREPSSSLKMVKKRLKETQEAVFVQNSGQHIPFIGIKNIGKLTEKIKKNGLLEPEELLEYADFLRGTRLIRNFFEKNSYNTPILSRYTQGLQDFTNIEEKIYSAISNNRVNDDYTRELRRIRQAIDKLEKDINESLQKFLRNPANRTYIQDSLIVKKNNKYTVPIKAEFKNMVSGSIIESSSKGTTVFVEPPAAARLTDSLTIKQAEETAEIYQILAELTGIISEQVHEIVFSIDTVTELDVIFARAKYSISIGGECPNVNKSENIKLINAKHPLLGETAVPLNLSLGDKYRALIITGANAGGKTVTLKTVALLTLLTMYGILIPCEEGTDIAVFDAVFIDIGDNQSMENSLSTFSAHMTNLKSIISGAGRNTLVLLDEIGSGTDPKEGAALGIAAMEELYTKGSLVIATTHYGEIKDYAKKHADFTTAAMEFNKETLMPYYRLLQGETGESAALLVAKRMGLQNVVVSKAEGIIKNQEYKLDKIDFEKASSDEGSDKSDKKIFYKGDKVSAAGEAEYGIFYENTDEHMAMVYFTGKMKEIPTVKLNLIMSADKLYPKGYDLETIFEEFAVRKRRRDLERGSKKAHKLLNKEMSERHGEAVIK